MTDYPGVDVGLTVKPIYGRTGGLMPSGGRCTNTMLGRMEELRIFEVFKVDGGFEIAEMCDKYFNATLTREQLADLGLELLAMALRG